MRLAPRAIAIVMALSLSGAAAAASDEAARALYVKTCSKCHGLIQEDAQSWRTENMVAPAVTLPLGPTLTGIYLRPAGTVKGYPYSKAFRAMATGWVWDENALDGWLASTQDFVRGSTMFLRVKEPARGKIIAYLKKYARYRGR